MKGHMRLTTAEYGRVLQAATKRKMRFDTFIGHVLMHKFSLPEQEQILRELGSKLVDHIFDTADYLASKNKVKP